jgi:sigma-E factor negative regulatory protein RseC
MIEETAHVVEIEGEFAWVETQRQSSCGSCAANKGCGTATLSKVLGQKRTRVRALNRAGAQAGDSVIVGIREDALVRGSLAVYAVPLLMMILGAFLGQAFGNAQANPSEGLTILCGLLGLVAGLWWLRRFARRASSDPRYQPVVLRRAFRSAPPESTVFTG